MLKLSGLLRSRNVGPAMKHIGIVTKRASFQIVLSFLRLPPFPCSIAARAKQNIGTGTLDY
jgi:hypothetical protein